MKGLWGKRKGDRETLSVTAQEKNGQSDIRNQGRHMAIGYLKIKGVKKAAPNNTKTSKHLVGK